MAETHDHHISMVLLPPLFQILIEPPVLPFLVFSTSLPQSPIEPLTKLPEIAEQETHHGSCAN